MKKFMLFGCDTYYPSGGWSDFIGDFDTVEDARAHINSQKYRRDSYDLINTETKEDHHMELGL